MAGHAEQPPLVPDYELVRRLGSGAFGSVWLARSRTGVHHAVKVVPKARVGALEKELQGLRAFEVLARRHPSLIEIRHVGETDDSLYYVMELADGYSTAATFSAEDYEPHTLDSDLRRHGALALERALEIALTVLDGLEHLHAQGLLHRDVKPANVVFVDGRAKLADLGLVTVGARRHDEAGTPAFMPPESVLDPSGDLFCLGKTLFHLVTGAPAARFPELPGQLDPVRLAGYRRIASVLDRACAPAREERFQSAREFRAAILAVAPGLDPGRRARGRKRLLVAGAVAAIAAAAVALTAGGDWLGRGRFPPGPVALEGHIELLYAEPVDPGVELAVSDSNPIVPLFTTGLLRIRASLSEPAYAVLAYFDDQGAFRVLVPAEGPAERVAALETPQLPLEEPPGTLTFVLLASREPIEDPAGIEAELDRLGDPPRCPPNALLVLGGEGVPRTVPGRKDRSRGPALDLGQPLDDSSPRSSSPGLLGRLRSGLGSRYALVRAIAVPQVTR